MGKPVAFEASAEERETRGFAQALVFLVGQGLLGRDRPRVARVDPHGVEVLDRAHDDAAPGLVDHHLELELLPAR